MIAFKARILVLASTSLMLLALAGQASAQRYYAQFWAREDGHIKMWWTKNGVRISEHPFVDDDYVKFTWYSEPAPTMDINDADRQWRRSGSVATSDTYALAGAAYAYERFEDYLADFGPSITWFNLHDQADLVNVLVVVDLVEWGEYLRTNALPDLDTVFLFDVTGRCPELPGYVATNLDTQDPFTGPMVVDGLTSLVVPEPATLGLLAFGGLAGGAKLLRLRRRRRSA